MELAKKTVDASVPAIASSLLHQIQAVPLRFTPQPGRTFFDGTTKELVTMSESELVRYGKDEPLGVRIPIQVRVLFFFFFLVVFSKKKKKKEPWQACEELRLFPDA